ncbi:MAG: AtpZ/AtpI family protein [bacterium]|nr:AtpZ/AtpI family protein [bacterium]
MLNSKGKLKEIKRSASYSSVGLMFPSSIAVGLAVGYFLDKWLNTAPYLLFIFLFYGIAAGFVNLFKVTNPEWKLSARKRDKEKSDRENNKKEPPVSGGDSPRKAESPPTEQGDET